MEKKLNFTCEAFNPLEHLVQSKTASGEPAYEPYVKNGVVVIENNHIVYVPKVHLDSNALRDWFHKLYPNGRMEVIDHTADPVYNADKGFIYPVEKFEVRLFENKNDNFYRANGFGCCEPTDKAQFSPTTSAISYAFINAMRNMGAGVDINFSDLMDELPKFMEIEGPLTTEGIESMYTPFTSGIYAEPKEKEMTQPGKEQEKTTKPKSEPKALSPMEYIEKKQAKQNKAAEEKPASTEKNVATKAESEVPKPAKAPQGLGSYENMTIEEAGEVVFETLESFAGNLTDFNGMKMSTLLVTKPRIVKMIGASTFKWEDKITPQTYKAANVLSGTIN